MNGRCQRGSKQVRMTDQSKRATEQQGKEEEEMSADGEIKQRQRRRRRNSGNEGRKGM